MFCYRSKPLGFVSATALLWLLWKKYPWDFFQSRQAGIKPKEAPFAETGVTE